MGVEDRGERTAGDSRDEAAVPSRSQRGLRVAYASCADAVAGAVPFRRFQGRTRSVHGQARPEFQRAVTIGSAARFSETGTGFANAKLSGGQEPAPAARVARFVRMTELDRFVGMTESISRRGGGGGGGGRRRRRRPGGGGGGGG